MICWECGNEFAWKGDYERYYCCEKCKEEAVKRVAKEKELYIKYKFLNMYETALRLLEGKTTRFSSHKKAAETVYRVGVEHPAAFDSSDEILATIVFLTSGYRVQTQVKIENYRVDCFLLKQKTIVEIDGETHASKSLYDSNRDKKIREILGPEWEIVRIPTKLLRKNPEMLIEAVRESRREKVRVRRENGGIIPAYYSKQRKAVMQKIEEMF